MAPTDCSSATFHSYVRQPKREIGDVDLRDRWRDTDRWRCSFFSGKRKRYPCEDIRVEFLLAVKGNCVAARPSEPQPRPLKIPIPLRSRLRDYKDRDPAKRIRTRTGLTYPGSKRPIRRRNASTEQSPRGEGWGWRGRREAQARLRGAYRIGRNMRHISDNRLTTAQATGGPPATLSRARPTGRSHCRSSPAQYPARGRTSRAAHHSAVTDSDAPRSNLLVQRHRR